MRQILDAQFLLFLVSFHFTNIIKKENWNFFEKNAGFWIELESMEDQGRSPVKSEICKLKNRINPSSVFSRYFSRAKKFFWIVSWLIVIESLNERFCFWEIEKKNCLKFFPFFLSFLNGKNSSHKKYKIQWEQSFSKSFRGNWKIRKDGPNLFNDLLISSENAISDFENTLSTQLDNHQLLLKQILFWVSLWLLWLDWWLYWLFTLICRRINKFSVL